MRHKDTFGVHHLVRAMLYSTETAGDGAIIRLGSCVSQVSNELGIIKA